MTIMTAPPTSITAADAVAAVRTHRDDLAQVVCITPRGDAEFTLMAQYGRSLTQRHHHLTVARGPDGKVHVVSMTPLP